MATYTSSQSGNFSASSTWGGSGVPGDGDRFDVAYGHTVTIDTGISIPTNGYADSYVYGILQSQSGANTTLRMNGRLYIKGGYEGQGLLHLRDGAKIQIKGTSADRHAVWVENEDGASFIFEGSDGMPSTTLTSLHNETSSSLSVTSGTNFATGEWIAVFDNVTNYTAENNNNAEQHQDEGFWIHEVDGNTIYLRIFGGPDDVTISSVSTVNDTDITVSNAKVFREGQAIIFGTGTNRNIRTISNIFYDQNIIRCNGAVDNSPSLVGQTVYLTGTEKKHTSSSKVRKVATVTTAESASGANTITVANSNMFTADDEIFIEMRSEANGSTDYEGGYDRNSYQKAGWYRHVIQSVDGNTITLTANSNYRVVEGALVSRLTRNIVIETLATDGSDYGSFYAEQRNATSSYSRKGIAKDVYFKNVGNNDSNQEAGFTIRGFWSTDNLPITLTEQIPSITRAPWIEGITVYAYPENTHRRDWGPLWLYDARYAKARCCISMNGEDGLCAYYEPGTSIVNCISAGARERGCRWEGSNETYEFAYNYISRTYWGCRTAIPYEHGLGFHDNIFDSGAYGIQTVNSEIGPYIYRCRWSGWRYGFQNSDSDMSFVYSHVKPLSGYVNADADTGTGQAANAYSNRMFRSNAYLPLRSIEHNYELDAMRIYGYNYEAKWDNSERAWRFFRRHDNSNDPALGHRVWIPANTAVNVSAYVKLAPSFSGTYPYLAAVDRISPVTENIIGNTGGADSSQWTGKRYTVQYTSAAASAYEQKTITIAAKPWPRQFYIAVYSSSNNATEGYWVKDLFIFIDKAYQISPFNTINNQNLFAPVPTSVGINTFAKPIIRIGGRIF